ncbi:BQ2448_426 [Microbotryum intermedium]|uniref:alpha-1,2-Mannosidase n=1 Tax=Microbotryum intermedium TaxID=269621 RepID=A0A238F5G3_9BASI|nr:BQ2448_426 [Microbotryum intermedium]
MVTRGQDALPLSSLSGNPGSHRDAGVDEHADIEPSDADLLYSDDVTQGLLDEEAALPGDVPHRKRTSISRACWGQWGHHRRPSITPRTIAKGFMLLGLLLLALVQLQSYFVESNTDRVHASPPSEKVPDRIPQSTQRPHPNKVFAHSRPIPPSTPDPWSHMPLNWEGRAWLAESRFSAGKGAASLPEQVGPPQGHLAKAFTYMQAATVQARLAGDRTRYDKDTGRTLQVPRSELKLLYEGWKKPQLKVGNLDKPVALGWKSKRPKVQYAGNIDLSDQRMQEENNRRDWVKRAFIHAWQGYKNSQWGHDEVKPVSGGSSDSFNGWGAVIIDNLDTLLIMGLNEEYNLARDHVSALDFSYVIPHGTDAAAPSSAVNSGPFPLKEYMSYFETTIRYLGGLISAYDLSGDSLMLERAVELGDWLLPALNTRYGVPNNRFFLGTNPSGSRTGTAWLAEVGTLSLEFIRLSMITGDETYYQAVQRITDALDEVSAKGPNHLLPLRLDVAFPNPVIGNTVSFGACADSYYEYLIKMAHLLGEFRPDGQYARMYRGAIDSAYESIIRPAEVIPDHPDLINIGENDFSHSNYVPKLEHLTCFAGGMLGLGAKLLARGKDLETGVAFTETCQWAYETSPTGLMPDSPRFFLPDDPGLPKTKQPAGRPPAGIRDSNPLFIGRPETIESVFYMWRITGDRLWQDRGWRMFVDWVSSSITEFGFVGVENVNDPTDTRRKDSQESFVLAETLKYYYLLFSDREHISLDQYVFNTEAHPFTLPTYGRGRPKKLWKGATESPEESARRQGTVVQSWHRVNKVAQFNRSLRAMKTG